ncbi:sensor histidine kinase [Spirosoma foliorum]|uniref:histidine kinase n=1 Tax=Spirosoma foliorum TaxID=2710596 RepID=A0A7G5H389_9BACT|nr:HAMP domain-containing sensor histidine kinase [Spirosoma foliorum]QMW05581.1 HAMP domain-containing histidine kinase [Spirosoma foliorum]
MVWQNPFHTLQPPGLSRNDQVKFKIIVGAQLIITTGLCLAGLVHLVAHQYSRIPELVFASLTLLPILILLKRYPFRIAALYFISIAILDAFGIAVLRISQGIDTLVENNYFYIVCISIFILDGRPAYFFAIVSGLLGLLIRGLAVYYLHEPNNLGQYISFIAPFMVVAFFSDWVKKLTDENQAAIESKNRRLSELNTLKDKLFNIIAHDLRIPIAILKMQLEQLRDRNPKSKRITISLEEYHRLVDSVDRTYVTLDNLLQWSLLQREALGNRPVHVDLPQLLQATLALYDNQLQLKELSLRTKMEPTEVFVDSYQVQIIIRNILQNAIKFTPVGGSLYLQTQAMADGTKLTLTDSGIGMDEPTIASLANSFISRPGTGGERGTGIGLQLVQELVAANGGQLTIQSQVGEGTTVEVLFPQKSI